MITTVRSEAKAQQILEANPSWKGKVHPIVIPDLTAPKAFDKLFDQTYDFIIHAASPVTLGVDDIQRDIIDPAINA